MEIGTSIILCVSRASERGDGQTETYSYFTGTNLLQDVIGTETMAYSYDANGNITGIGNKILIYNQNNRLIRVEENGDILGEYTYNGLGQRVIKEADGITTVFHYDFNGNIIAESDLDGNFTKEYLYRGKSRSAMVDVSSGEIYYFGNDRLGTPQIMTDSTNTVVWEGIYKPFGEADVNPNSNVVNNFRFAGQYYDQETGLHYNYHRYYDPRTGRYLRADPIGLEGGINLFVYAGNNPINLIDPEGLRVPGWTKALRWGLKRLAKWIGGKTGEKIGDWADLFENEIADPPEEKESYKDTDNDGIKNPTGSRTQRGQTYTLNPTGSNLHS